MKAIKYFVAGALMLGISAQVMAQDVKSKIDAITKVIVSNNGAGPDVDKLYRKTKFENQLTPAWRLGSQQKSMHTEGCEV